MENPGREKTPREHPVRSGLITCSRARDSRKGQSLEVGVRRTGLWGTLCGNKRRANGMRVRRLQECGGHLSRGERFEGENPKSAVGMKQTRPGVEGRKPSRG
jgi:hypothetical protein